jgi:hypothetical protein
VGHFCPPGSGYGSGSTVLIESGSGSETLLDRIRIKSFYLQAELDNISKPPEGGLEEDDDDSSSATPSRPGSRPPSLKGEEPAEAANAAGHLPFPDHSALNSR